MPGLKRDVIGTGWLLHQLVEQHVASLDATWFSLTGGNTRKKGHGERGVIISGYSTSLQDQPHSILVVIRIPTRPHRLGTALSWGLDLGKMSGLLWG